MLPFLKFSSIIDFCPDVRPAWWNAIPFLRHIASLSHCCVGLESELKASSEILFSFSSFAFIFFDMSSAVFSADFFVLTKTRACFPIFVVSSARLMAALSDTSSTLNGFDMKKIIFYGFISV